MKERPILFSAAMVRSILSNTKTQTRRPIKPALSGREWVEQRETGGFWRCADGEPTCHAGVWETHEYAQQYPIVCPYGQPGEKLWVREAWARTVVGLGTEMVVYREGDNRTDYGGPWKPSIHMPRAASRITLEVTGVRVERLQDISEADAIAEGIHKPLGPQFWHTDPGANILPGDTPVWAYRNLWESINGPGSWDANPWVWCVEFKRVQP